MRWGWRVGGRGVYLFRCTIALVVVVGGGGEGVEYTYVGDIYTYLVVQLTWCGVGGGIYPFSCTGSLVWCGCGVYIPI